MNIMVDYDGTYTADVDMWRDILPRMKQQGHNIYLVTSRSMDQPIELVQDFVQMKIPIIYCNFKAKETICNQRGIKIDIWIDNDPYYITEGIQFD